MLGSDSRRAIALMLGVCAVGLGCTRNPAPAKWLKPAKEATADPYGAWIEITSDDKPVAVLLRGELLSIERDSVFVLQQSGEVGVRALAASPRARVAFYDGKHGNTASWTLLGVVSSVSNGFFLALTAPAWILTGTFAAVGDSKAPIVTLVTSADWVGARKYARFPANMPSGLPRRLPVKR